MTSLHGIPHQVPARGKDVLVLEDHAGCNKGQLNSRKLMPSNSEGSNWLRNAVVYRLRKVVTNS